MEMQVLSVTQLNEAVKKQLDGVRAFQDLYVRGEISNYKAHPNGYSYFYLKDQGAVLSCTMMTRTARFQLENGMKTVLRGRVSAYVKGGVYQLFVTGVTLEGEGELAVAFRQLKEQLYREGLFDQAHKKPLPRFPEKIAVITAASGKAVHDVINTLRSRYPSAKVLMMSVRVQGERAPREIVGALAYANRWKLADVIITGRGGGSMEELWAFNDERVARAIYASEIPVISAVGHEPDETIADFVADARAATPTQAAVMAASDRRELLRWLRDTQAWMVRQEQDHLNVLRRRLEAQTSKRVMQNQLAYVQDRQTELAYLQRRLGDLFDGQLARRRTRLAGLSAALDAMSPLKVFARGYAMVQDGEGNILRSWRDAEPGTTVRVTLGDGGFTGTVNQPYEKESDHGRNDV